MADKVTQILEDIGFEEREVRVYLSLLELGSSTVLPISKKAEIKRTYCYDVLDSLIKKGAVTYFEQTGRRRYVAEDPAVIQQALKNRLAQLSAVLPEMRLVYNNRLDKPVVRFYEGQEALIGFCRELTQTKEYCAIVSAEHLSSALGNLEEELAKLVVTNQTKARELIAHTTAIPRFSTIYKKPLQEVRMLPKGMAFETDLLLYDGKLVLVSYGSDIHAVVIEGSAVVETQQKLFDYMWQMTPSMD